MFNNKVESEITSPINNITYSRITHNISHLRISNIAPIYNIVYYYTKLGANLYKI